MMAIVRGGITLAAIGGVCAALIVATWNLTTERIAANERAHLERSLQPALGDLVFDSGLIDSRFDIPAPHDLPGNDTASVYRAYQGGKPAAALFAITARDGYSGPIRLLVGVGYDGALTGIHVLEHRETPGLGDGIETSKSPWSLQFRGRSLLDPDAAGWAIRADGGQFDQLTGASVTPRAVIKAVRQTLIYFDANRDMLFAAPATRETTT